MAETSDSPSTSCVQRGITQQPDVPARRRLLGTLAAAPVALAAAPGKAAPVPAQELLEGLRDCEALTKEILDRNGAALELLRRTRQAVEDPHIEWWRERERLIARLDALKGAGDDMREPVLHAKWVIENRIANTPAATLAGLRLQAQVGLRYLEEELPPGAEPPQIEVRALRNAIATLEQLTGRASA